ncbi:ribosome biogenesis GTP-binding protein YihA/YsxC [Metamycoplasma equirhinis]|uniref:Probable GTP-binding protein EngB n=1 Tax=Metamycoplasma equirhinis TaxID=92402 RepID=A0ABZ0PA91_9BACT|nr:ribosome biogenesis GTP-binding protein YihA/YsxC [Metamycoplasma equirhinis]TPD99395.1 YihA family ribosome biogenesis GTP-binding protein [Metamycoplasma equirhinis]WPB53863.1 ribosome biogenesis GTP-binding protein YihA/YsxC [Metamycoplasma equirhinis]
MWKYLKSTSNENSWKEFENENQMIFWGRSNVGKSSLINSLAKQKIAKTSSTPGRTKLINYFLSDSNKLVIDLPGYGYAAISKKEQEKIARIIDFFFRNSKAQKTVCVLIDCKVGFMAIDIEMINYLYSLNIKIDVFITKIDKANQSQKYKVKKQALELNPEINIFMVSSIKAQGIEDIIEFYSL